MTKSKGRVAHGKKIAEAKWGKRFLIAVFPLKEGKQKVTLIHKGKEMVFGGTDRKKLLEKAFKFVEDNL